jgi:membrane protein implicated in regulation of membrane protease activity
MIVVFLMVEASTVSLVSLWFALGSLAAMLLSLLKTPVWLQSCVFLIVSAVCLTALRPLVRKYIKPKLTKTNVDAVIGTTGLVTVAVDNVSAVGQVKLGAMYWTARSTGGEPIAEGALIRVDRIEGVKAFVSPVNAPVTQ